MTNEQTQSVPQDTIERDFHQGTHTCTRQGSNDTAQGAQPVQAPHATQSASSAQATQAAARLFSTRMMNVLISEPTHSPIEMK